MHITTANVLERLRPPAAILMAALLAVVLSGCAYVNVSLKDERRPLEETVVAGRGFYKILLMDLSGLISSQERQAGLIGGTVLPSLVSEVREQLRKAEDDWRVRAVVIRINSPGGTVTASDMLYRDILAFRERTGKPVIASILDLGTSGAYYVAQAADRIFAHPTSVTGSIGVIMVRPDIAGLMQKLGIRTTEIKAGELKAMGSPFKPLTPEEQAVFQGVIDAMYDRFVQVVADGRAALGVEQVRSLADGRIYTAQQALDLGLVDRIGYLEDALAAARELAALERARVVMYHRPGDFKGSIYAGPFELLSTPQLLYLWLP